MKTFDQETLDTIDWFASAMVTDFYVPKDQAGKDRMERLEVHSTDLNLLKPVNDIRSDASAAGASEAYDIVQTDIARRISTDLVAANDAGDLPGLVRHPQFDTSIPFNPDRHAVPIEERPVEKTAFSRNDRFDEAFSKPPISVETAHALGSIGERLAPSGRISAPKDAVRSLNETSMYADQLERIARQRDLSTDPDAKSSYDVVAIDLGTRLSVVMAQGLEKGHLPKDLLDEREFALVTNPHAVRAGTERSITEQARSVSTGHTSVTSKGPDQDRPAIDMKDRGTGR